MPQNIGTKYNTQIPTLAESADIQAALKLYHYGQSSDPGNVTLTAGVAYYLQQLQAEKAPIASPTFTGTVTLPTGTVTSSMIANGAIVNEDISSSASIAVSKLANGTNGYVLISGSSSPQWVDFSTAGTITTAINLSGSTVNSIPYQSASGTTSYVAPNSSTIKYLSQTSSGTPIWSTVSKTEVGLGNVENTALSTWTGSTNITTLGTIGTGTWNATVIADSKIASALTGKTYNGLTLTAATTGFTVAGGTTSKTLTVSNTLTLAGTDSSTLNIGSGGTLGSAAFTASTAYLASGVTSLPSVTSVNSTTIPSSSTLVTTVSTDSIAANAASATKSTVTKTSTTYGKVFVVDPLPVAATSATIGTRSGTGPYTATVTLSGTIDWTVFNAGSVGGTSNGAPVSTITATAGTGNLGTGVVTVTSVNQGSSTITISSTLTFTAGTITNIIVSNHQPYNPTTGDIWFW